MRNSIFLSQECSHVLLSIKAHQVSKNSLLATDHDEFRIRTPSVSQLIWAWSHKWSKDLLVAIRSFIPFIQRFVHGFIRRFIENILWTFLFIEKELTRTRASYGASQEKHEWNGRNSNFQIEDWVYLFDWVLHFFVASYSELFGPVVLGSHLSPAFHSSLSSSACSFTPQTSLFPPPLLAFRAVNSVLGNFLCALWFTRHIFGRSLPTGDDQWLCYSQHWHSQSAWKERHDGRERRLWGRKTRKRNDRCFVNTCSNHGLTYWDQRHSMRDHLVQFRRYQSLSTKHSHPGSSLASFAAPS